VVLVASPVLAQDAGGGATATGISRDFNPAISLNALFLASDFQGVDVHADAVSEEAGLEPGIALQEIELQFSSAIDAYGKADLIFTFEDGTIGLEEAYATTNVLPGGFGLRAGQVFVPLGHENTLHTHQLPFVERSLFAKSLFGGESLAEFGAELDYVVPVDFYLQVRGGVFNGDNVLFAGQENWDLAYLGGIDALWDVSENGALALGTDYMAGPNSFGSEANTELTQLFAAVARYKWKSANAAHPRALEVMGEFLFGQRDADSTQAAVDPAELPARFVHRGAYGLANYRFQRRWWLQGRYDWYDPEAEESTRASIMLAFVPTEFSALRLEAGVVDLADNSYSEFRLQYNFTIGSHPAHRY
jgi:hypothetical protein